MPCITNFIALGQVSPNVCACTKATFTNVVYWQVYLFYSHMRQLLVIETVFFIEMKIYIIWEMTSKLINLHQRNWMWSNLDDISLKKWHFQTDVISINHGCPLENKQRRFLNIQWQLEYLDFERPIPYIQYPDNFHFTNGLLHVMSN